MKIKRYVAAAVTAGVLGTVTLATGITALAATGWVQNGSSYVYYDTDGTLHKGWVQTGDGYYYMDLSTGVMSTGIKKINDKLYYFGSNGIMQTGLIRGKGHGMPRRSNNVAFGNQPSGTQKALHNEKGQFGRNALIPLAGPASSRHERPPGHSRLERFPGMKCLGHLKTTGTQIVYRGRGDIALLFPVKAKNPALAGQSLQHLVQPP